MKTKMNDAKRRRANKGLVRAATDIADVRQRLKANLASLRASGEVPSPTLELIEELAHIGARRIADLGDYEVVTGMTTAAAVAALSCGTTPQQFVAWLRLMAASVSSTPSTTKGA